LENKEGSDSNGMSEELYKCKICGKEFPRQKVVEFIWNPGIAGVSKGDFVCYEDLSKVYPPIPPPPSLEDLVARIEDLEERVKKLESR